MPNSKNQTLIVEVVYCQPEQQTSATVQLEAGSTVVEAIRRSGLLEQFALDLLGDKPTPIGIFGKQCALNTIIKSGDRIEIYRPLLLTPTEARRLRAKTLPKT